MKNLYIEELMKTLDEVEIWEKVTKKYSDYSVGIQMLVEYFTKHKKNDSRVFFIGNGGSAAIASHMTADYMKNGGMNTYSLYDSAVATCMGNDYGYENIFSKPMQFLIKENDLLVVISSSGNSKNILSAIKVAKENGGGVVTLTGFSSDNQAKQMGDINVYVPSNKYGIVESIHNIILQQVVDEIMERDGVEI